MHRPEARRPCEGRGAFFAASAFFSRVIIPSPVLIRLKGRGSGSTLGAVRPRVTPLRRRSEAKVNGLQAPAPLTARRPLKEVRPGHGRVRPKGPLPAAPPAVATARHAAGQATGPQLPTAAEGPDPAPAVGVVPVARGRVPQATATGAVPPMHGAAQVASAGDATALAPAGPPIARVAA